MSISDKIFTMMVTDHHRILRSKVILGPEKIQWIYYKNYSSGSKSFLTFDYDVDKIIRDKIRIDNTTIRNSLSNLLYRLER